MDTNNLKIEEMEIKINQLNLKVEGLEELNKKLEDQILELKNNLIDKDFENGIFVEKETFNKLDSENVNLRKLLEEYYKKELQEWKNELKKEF
jgi:hypothetical protein